MSTIFKDKDKLSSRYIPQRLPHRDGQMDMLKNFFGDILDHPSRAYLRVTQIIGGVGTGKTACTIRFGQNFEDEARDRGIDLKHVYVNLKLHGWSRVTLYRYIVERATPEIYSPHLSAGEMLSQLVRHLRSEGKYLLISLDEIDYFVKHSKESVVYDLTRVNELYPGETCGVVGLIFTARSKDFHDLLDRAELSTLGRHHIDFGPYTSPQIRDILEQRVEEAFQLGAVSEEILEYVADVTASTPIDGDVRYALDLLHYSGDLADMEGSRTITPEHVRRVHGEMHPFISSEDILDLPDQEKVILLGVVRALQTEKSAYVPLRSIRSMCGVVFEEYGLKPVEDLESFVQDLADRDIIDIKSLVQIGISGVPTETLDRFLEGLIERVKSGLSES
ncbi:MAG: Cdc6/Cdc18 family protein [Candidatus Geothermarchaeales archaeon]